MIPKINQYNSFQAFQVFKYGAQLFVNVALAKTYLSSFELGVFESFIFISSSFSFFWVTGLMQTLLGFYPNLNEQSGKRSVFVNFAGVMVALSFFSVIGVVLYLFLSNSSLNLLQILFLLYYMLLNPVSFIAEYILLLEQKYNQIFYYGVLTLFTPCIIVAFPVFLGEGLDTAFLGLCIWASLKFAYTILLLNKYSTWKTDKSMCRKIVSKSLPLIGSTLLVGSAAYVDGYIIKGTYNNEVFAVFRYGAREFPLFLLVASAFSNSMIPQFGKDNNLDNALRELKTNSRKMILRYFPLAGLLLMTSHFLFPIVFNDSFQKSFEVFDVYLLLIISRFVFPQSILIGLQKNKTMLFVSFAELLVNVLCSLVLVQYFGYIGVAFGTVIAYLFEKVLLVYLLKIRLMVNPSNYLPFPSLLISTIIIILLFVIKKLLI